MAVTKINGSLTFEVAAVKPTEVLSGVVGGCRGIDTEWGPNKRISAPPLGRCTIYAGRLNHMIGMAYDLPMNQIKFDLGGPYPAWLDARFDLQGKAEVPEKATEAQLITMFRNLLTERFHLKFHQEDRPVDGYELVAKNGSKLRAASANDEHKLSWGGLAATMLQKKAAPGGLADAGGMLSSLTGRKVTMAELANAIATLTAISGSGGPVADHTGLKGEYNFNLSWEGDENVARFLEEQLGLRLVKTKVPSPFFVIEAAAPPSEN